MEAIEDIDVRSRIAELAVKQPDGIAILPANLETATSESDFVYAGSAEDVAKLLRQSGLRVQSLSPHPLPTRRDHDVTLVLPTLFVAAAYLSENPNAISVTLSVIANYAMQMMQGIPRGGKVRLSVSVETTKTKVVKRIDYEGPPTGLSEVTKLAETVHGTD
jgi:hypothetical protein